MCYRYGMFPMALAAALLAGCGGSSDSGESTGTAAIPAQTGAAAPGAMSDPVEAVTTFLTAVRSGDDATAAAMFTKTAREKAAEMNIEVAPKGSDTARFQVGQVEYIDNSLAKVPSSWSDYDPQGELRTDHMAWMLRREPEGWRVAGMAATVFEGEPPLLLDFENPEETLRKLDSLRDEIIRRGEQEALQAAQPASPSSEILR
jgi:hypothetical protein